MTLKRKRSVKRVKRAFRRKYLRKRVARSRIGRSVSEIHRFSRMSSDFQIQLAAGTSYANGTILYQLDNLINYTEFTALFDQYKIERVEVTFKMHTNPFIIYATQYTSGTVAAAPITFPTLFLHNDFDDGTSLAKSEFQERQGTVKRVLAPNKVVKWSVRPCILAQTYRTVSTTGYAPKRGVYIDCAQANVPHYGTKWGIDYDGYTLPATAAGPYGQNIDVTVSLRYFFVCKNVR